MMYGLVSRSFEMEAHRRKMPAGRSVTGDGCSWESGFAVGICSADGCMGSCDSAQAALPHPDDEDDQTIRR